MIKEAFKRAIEIHYERKKLEKELALLDNQKEEDLAKYLVFCKRLFELEREFASL